MNCVNGHSVLESMKFCSVCGVALAQLTEPTGQPEQNNSGVANNTPQLPEPTKKKSNKFAISLILLALFVAWASNDDGSSTSETGGSASTSEPITQEETSDQSGFDGYLPLVADFEVKFAEMADYAFAEDAESLVASCYGLKDLTEQGLALQSTGNLDFDQAWGDAMDAGMKVSEACIDEEFDVAATYISEMTEHINTATLIIE